MHETTFVVFRAAVIPAGLHSRLSGEAFNRQGEIHVLLEAAPRRDEVAERTETGC